MELNVNEVREALRRYLGAENVIIEKVSVKWGASDLNFPIGPGGRIGLEIEVRKP